MKLNKRGSNQYMRRFAGAKYSTWKDVIFLFLLAVSFATVGWKIQHSPQPAILSPISLVHSQDRTPAASTGERVYTWDDVKLACVKIARKYNVPPSIMMSVMAIESARGTSEYCVNRNNCFGLGAYDSNPDNAYDYGSKTEGCETYAKFVTGQAPDGMYPSPLIRNAYRYAATLTKEPEKMIQAIKDALYATDPDYVTTVTSTPEYHEYTY